MKAVLFAAALAGVAVLVVPALAESTSPTPPASGQRSDDAGAMPMANAMSGSGMVGPMMGMMRMMSMMGGAPNMMGQMPAGTMMGGSPKDTGSPQSQPHPDK